MSVAVLAIKPFWRWAVGPRRQEPGICAIPFYTRRGADDFYAEMLEGLPPARGFDPPVMYRKAWFRRIEEVAA